MSRDMSLKAASGHRFPALDAIRGVGAFVVMIFHGIPYRLWFPTSELTVDMFYIISGFLVSYAYNSRLENGFGAYRFVVARLGRLYPISFLGAVLGAFLVFGHYIFFKNTDHDASSMVLSALLSVFLLPYFGNAINHMIFSFNGPLWSMFFEIFVTILYALTWRLINKKTLLLIIPIGLFISLQTGPFPGPTKEAFYGGFARVIAGYFSGVLVFQLWMRGYLPKFKLSPTSLAIITIAIICIPLKNSGLAIIVEFFTLWCVVVISVNINESAYSGTFAKLGAVSFPIYVFHWPILNLMSVVGAMLGLDDPNRMFPLVTTVCITPLISQIVVRYYEKPAREIVNHVLLGSTAELRFSRGEG